MCLISSPKVRVDYAFLKELGKGSQGTVNLCKKKEIIRSSLSNNNTRRNEEDLFAIKKYTEHVHRESYYKYKPSLRFDQVAINEFAFTRQLRMCSNII